MRRLRSSQSGGTGWRVVVLFVLSQIAATFALLEVGARLFDPLGISYYPETARLLDEMILEEPIGYRLPPNLDGSFHGAIVRTSALGLRERPVPPHKEPGEFRILVMGDSVVFSVGVEDDETVPYQIERIANESAPPGRHYRTLNMGVPSYNTEQQLVQLEELGLSLQPDAAVLFLVPNDLETKMWVFEKRANLFADLAQRSYAASLLFVLLRPLTAGVIAVSPEVTRSRSPDGSARPGSNQNPRVDAIEKSLREIGRQLREIDVPFLVLHAHNVSNEVLEVIRSVGSSEGFAVRSINPWSDPRWESEDPLDYRNSVVDNHCNARGCERNAILMYEYMVAAGLLD